MIHRNALVGAATVLLGITLFFWLLVLSSVIGLTNFLRGNAVSIMPAVLIVVMILLPVVAVGLAVISRRKDDQAQIG
ncbi:MAG: hypothetical protein WBP29_02495 [Candidatus Zixiibacteriota bacterium]